jgi:glycosyltransferase involved in cell wall biosynthesis
MIYTVENNMTKQRILHFIESEGVYGAERVILNLSQQLQSDNHFVSVVGCIVNNPTSQSDLYDAAQAAGIEAIKIPIANKYLLFHLPKAAKQLKNSGINLIHSHGYKPAVYGFIIRLLTGIPILSTCHLWFEPAKAPLKTRVMIWLEQFFYQWYPKIVGVSEPILDVLRKRKLPNNKLALIRNGVDIPPTTAEDTLKNLRTELKLTPNDYCVINCARLTRQKNQVCLIEAGRILKEKSHSIKILILGQGPLEAELKQKIQQAGMEQYVHLLGFREDIPALLEIADAFVLPSLDEGMPMSLLEAAASSKPIITTIVGDIGKLIKHNETGLVIPVNDPDSLANAIMQLRGNSALARTLAENAHAAMVKHYSSYAMSQQYILIYRELLASP